MMKKHTFFATLLILGLFSSSCVIGSFDTQISGSGNVEKESRDIEGFTGVHLSSGIDVHLTEGDVFEVVVEADDNLLEVIQTELKGSVLVVGTERGVNIRRAKSKKVYLTLPRLESLKISSAGDCDGKSLFHCEDLRIDVSSAGDLLLEVEAKRIDLDISSSGDVKLSGEVDEFNADLSSAGDLHAFDLVARKVDVSVSSAGDARVHATDEISMRASSAGDIHYMGGAEVIHSSKSSAGSIIKK